MWELHCFEIYRKNIYSQFVVRLKVCRYIRNNTQYCIVFSCLILTLFVRPVQPLQLLFTYIIPIVPICFAWDGQVSYTRIYTFDDIDILLRGNESPNYKWTKGYAKDENGRNIGTFVLGLPVKSQ